MIRVEMLPVEDGDCLWVEWLHQGRWHRMLIDGGRGSRNRPNRGLARRLAEQPSTDRVFELVVCTHIDLDHIGGLLGLFAAPPIGFVARDVWFNGRHQLTPDPLGSARGDELLLGPAQGDELSALLVRRSQPWNAAFDGGAVVLPDQGPLPVVHLPGLRLTVLSPTWEHLTQLRAAWPETLEVPDAAAGPAELLGGPDDAVPLTELDIRRYRPDLSVANGSSIALLAEDDEGTRVLFGADAHAEVLVSSLRRRQRSGRIRVDLCKVPHHGSAHNVSEDLIRTLDCGHWLISTSGARFGHPSRRAIARIVRHARNSVLWFNYQSPTTKEYGRASVRAANGFEAVYPPGDRGARVLVTGGAVVRADEGSSVSSPPPGGAPMSS